MIQRMLAIWSLVPLPFLSPACTFGSSWITYCWSLAWRILTITLLACVCMCCYFSHVQLFETLWIVARQAPLSMGFSRQEYWSGLPCPPPGHIPDQGSNPCLLHLPHCRQILYCWAPREAPASMWNEHYHMVVWTFFGTALLWDGNKNWHFSVLWPLLSFPNLLAYWV